MFLWLGIYKMAVDWRTNADALRQLYVTEYIRYENRRYILY